MNIFTNKKLDRKLPSEHAPYAVGVELGELYQGKGDKVVTINEKAGTIRFAYTSLKGKNMNVKCKFYPEERKAFNKTIKRLNLPANGKVYPYWN